MVNAVMPMSSLRVRDAAQEVFRETKGARARRCFTLTSLPIMRRPEIRSLDPENTPSRTACPALVLNADYTPLSYYPLSVWPWQTAIKAVFLDRVDIVDHYDREVRSASFAMKLPSVIALKHYVKPSEHPAFTRFNLFLRDRFQCQYCGISKESGRSIHVHSPARKAGGRPGKMSRQPVRRAT